MARQEDKKKLSIISRAVMHGGNAADIGSTVYGLKTGRVKEQNPIYGNSPTKVGIIKAATSAAEDYMLSKLSKKHSKLANGMAKGIGIGMMMVAANNMRAANK